MKRFAMYAVLAVLTAFVIVACGTTDVDAALLEAAEAGNLERVNEMLGRGADVNTVDEFGRTPLMLAAFRGHAPVVDSLISAGADLDVTARFGQTAIVFAEQQGHPRIAAMIEDARTVDATDDDSEDTDT